MLIKHKLGDLKNNLNYISLKIEHRQRVEKKKMLILILMPATHLGEVETGHVHYIASHLPLPTRKLLGNETSCWSSEMFSCSCLMQDSCFGSTFGDLHLPAPAQDSTALACLCSRVHVYVSVSTCVCVHSSPAHYQYKM